MNKSNAVHSLKIVLFIALPALLGALIFIGSGYIIKTVFKLDTEIDWRFSYDLAKYGTGTARTVGAIAVLTGILVPPTCYVIMIVAAFLPKRRLLYGDARLATIDELREAGLLRDDQADDKYPSLIVGMVSGKYLLWRSQQFLFLGAPTRSGKGVSMVIPNLLHYRDSVICLDVKKENFLMTSGFRHQSGQEVHCFAPDSEDCVSAGWNPLDYIRDDPLFRVGDISKIANSLYPILLEDVWGASAQEAFIGMVMYIMETAKFAANLNLDTISKLPDMAACFRDEDAFREHVETRNDYEPLSDEALSYLWPFVRTSDKQRASVMISFKKPLGIYRDPITALATKTSTFDLRDVRRKRMTIYVCVNPSNLARFEQLLNLFFEQALNLNMQTLPDDDPSLKYQCLVLLDEFPAAGKLLIVEKASGYAAGYNMRLVIIAQSVSQLKDQRLYGEQGSKTLLTNMGMVSCFAPRDQDDAESYSRMLGTSTVKGRSISRPLGFGTGTQSESISDQRREVLLPDEVKNMGQNSVLLSIENVRTALVIKIRWYEQPVFKSRANLPLPLVPCGRPALNVIEPSAPMYRHTITEGNKMLLGGSIHYEIGFSPKRGALDVVLAAIELAQSEILLAAYSLTHKAIALALVDARNRGVSVNIVVDNDQNGDEQAGYKAVEFLESQNIPVVRNRNYSAMHHKFIVVDCRHVQFGSFNYTPSADRRNAEVALLLLDVPKLAETFMVEFKRLSNEPHVGVGAIIELDNGLAVLAEYGL
jgi:type IV secretion system protein VirD4